MCDAKIVADTATVWVQFTGSASRERCTHYNEAPPECGFGGRAVRHFPSICSGEELKLYVCPCTIVHVCTSVLALSFNPLQHTESWKLLPDIHKQWPRKTMQTRCLGSFPCPHVQQLAKLLLPPPTPFSSSSIRHRPRCGFM